MLRLLKTNRPLQRIGALGVAVLAGLCGGTAIVLSRLHDETLAEATLGLRTLNASLADKLKSEGMELNTPDPAAFRDKLRSAGFYASWRDKYGQEPWDLLEKAVGKLV